MMANAPPPKRPISFVSGGGYSSEANAPPPPPPPPPPAGPPPESAEEVRARRLAAVPDALRDAVAKLDPDVSEPALAFFGMAFGPERTGMEQIVLETDWDDAQVVLKLDFEGKTWKRVRKKAKK